MTKVSSGVQVPQADNMIAVGRIAVRASFSAHIPP
jgi:hypothetical protein